MVGCSLHRYRYPVVLVCVAEETMPCSIQGQLLDRDSLSFVSHKETVRWVLVKQSKCIRLNATLP